MLEQSILFPFNLTIFCIKSGAAHFQSNSEISETCGTRYCLLYVLFIAGDSRALWYFILLYLTYYWRVISTSFLKSLQNLTFYWRVTLTSFSKSLQNLTCYWRVTFTSFFEELTKFYVYLLFENYTAFKLLLKRNLLKIEVIENQTPC